MYPFNEPNILLIFNDVIFNESFKVPFWGHLMVLI
jgi:hypothetical protein